MNAGHNPALLCPPGETVPRLIEASGTPLGLLPGAQYTPEHAPFPAGARLLLYTDGLTEVFRGDEEFGTDRLAALFGNLPRMQSENVLAALWDRLSEFTGYAPQGDDMTAVALCH